MCSLYIYLEAFQHTYIHTILKVQRLFANYTDVNECSSGQHRCSAEAECVNTEASYECHCRSGHEGDGVTCTGGN